MTKPRTGVIKGVRVDGHNVILATKDNDSARELCATLVELLFVQATKPARTCRAGTENPCLPCYLDHGDCVAPEPLPAFDGVEEAQMAARRADALNGPRIEIKAQYV